MNGGPPVVASSHTSVTSPIAAASSIDISRPLTMSSIARALPTRRASRCVPPVPGSTPSATSGRPILPASLRRDAQVGGHRHLEPAADGVAVERRDHELRRLLEPVQRLVRVQAEVVLELRIGVLEHADVAPAQKNFSPAPVSTMTWTASSMRAVEDRGVELAHHLVAVGVGGRLVQRQQRRSPPLVADVDSGHVSGLRLGPHVLEVHRLAFDAARRRRDVVGELARSRRSARS